MTSDRQQRANRANAKSSTGPETAAGKARAAQNAFRHGLNVPVRSDPLLAPEIEAMALRISGPYADTETVEGARRIAEAQFDLNRVRNRRRLLITQFLVNPYFVPRHIRRLQLWSLHLALGARFRVLPIEGHRSESIRSRRYLTPCLPRAKKSLRRSYGKRLRSLLRLIGTSGALCRDAKPRSAILTRLERSLSRSAHTKLNVTYERPTKMSEWFTDRTKWGYNNMSKVTNYRSCQ